MWVCVHLFNICEQIVNCSFSFSLSALSSFVHVVRNPRCIEQIFMVFTHSCLTIVFLCLLLPECTFRKKAEMHVLRGIEKLVGYVAFVSDCLAAVRASLFLPSSDFSFVVENNQTHEEAALFQRWGCTWSTAVCIKLSSIVEICLIVSCPPARAFTVWLFSHEANERWLHYEVIQ